MYTPTMFLLVIGMWLHGPKSSLSEVETSTAADELSERVYVWPNDRGQARRFQMNGFMPDGNGIGVSEREERESDSRSRYIRVNADLSGARVWLGAYCLVDGVWQPTRPFNVVERLTRLSAAPPPNTGERLVLRFWLRSKDDHPPRLLFRVGGVTKGHVKDSLSVPVPTKWIQATNTWTRYDIDLTSKDLSSVVNGFGWICDRQHAKDGAIKGDREIEFDLADIYFVRIGETSNSDSP